VTPVDVALFSSPKRDRPGEKPRDANLVLRRR
jgi:hypothetical protein